MREKIALYCERLDKRAEYAKFNDFPGEARAILDIAQELRSILEGHEEEGFEFEGEVGYASEYEVGNDRKGCEFGVFPIVYKSQLDHLDGQQFHVKMTPLSNVKGTGDGGSGSVSALSGGKDSRDEESKEGGK